MEDVIDSEADKHDDSYRFVWAKLKTFPVHKCDDTENDNHYAEDGRDADDEVSGDNH